MSTVLETMMRIIEAQLDISLATIAAKLEATVDELRFHEDLEADSLDLAEMIIALEEAFDGEISDEEAIKIKTIGDAAALIENAQQRLQRSF